MKIDVIGSLKRHWLVATVVFLGLMVAGGYAAIRKTKPSYYAEAIVYVSPKPPKLLTGDSELDRPYDSYIQDEVHTVTRYDIIAEAIAKLPEKVRHRTGEVLPGEIEILQDNLNVSHIGSTYQVAIGLSGRKPDDLAEIVNAVTNTYIDKAKNEEFYGRDERLSTLNDERQRLQTQLDQKLTEQAHLMQDLGVATIAASAGATNPYDSELLTLKGQLASAREQSDAANAALSAATKSNGVGQPSALESSADELIAVDPRLSSLNTRRSALVAEMNGLKPDHPVYQKDKDEVAAIDAQLQSTADGLRHDAASRILQKLRSEVTRTRTLELQLTEEVAAKTNLATSAAPKIQRASELNAEIEELQKDATQVDQRIRDLELESSAPGSIHMFTAARTPLGPQKSKRPMMLMALLIVSLGVSVVSVVAIDMLDPRIYNTSDVERVVGFHPIGTLLNHEEFSTNAADEYFFRLAAGIDHAVRSSGARTFVFTSLKPGNGTSTVVEKLSRELTSLELRTLTIVTSGGGEPIAFSNEEPSSDLILRERKREEIQETVPARLTMASQESRQRTANTAPAPNTVARALHQAGAQYDVVLIDASPLPISADTEYLARISDATVLVVEAGVTTKHHLSRAARLLQRLNVAGVAVVLNKVGIDRADSALRQDLREYEESAGYQQRSSMTERAARQRQVRIQSEGPFTEDDPDISPIGGTRASQTSARVDSIAG